MLYKDEILGKNIVEQQVKLIGIFSHNIQKAMDGELVTDSDYFFALQECVLPSLTFAGAIGKVGHTVLKREDVITAIAIKPSEPFVLDGHSRAFTFILNMDLAKRYLFDALLVYDKPSFVKKILLTDKIIVENFDKSFKKIGKCFQLFGLLAKDYGRETSAFFSENNYTKENDDEKR